MYNKIKAFSLTELMILMLLVSIALSASIPVITKKHLQLPTTTEHGSYICYYDESGQLHEKRFANRFGLNQPILDQVTNNCIFNPPQKATYYQISAIGGGGGGGDSGYTGGNRHSDWIPLKSISPFGISDENLVDYNISYEDFTTYSGTLYAFARGSDSGAGGNTNYVTHNTPCVASHYEDELKGNGTLTGGTVAEGEVEEGKDAVECSYTYSYLDCSYETKKKNVPYSELIPGSCNDVTSESKYCDTPKTKTITKSYYGCQDSQTGLVNWSTSPSNRDACVAGNNSRFKPVSKVENITVDDGCSHWTTVTNSVTECKYRTKYEEKEYKEYSCSNKTKTVTTTGANCVTATTKNVDLSNKSYVNVDVCDKYDDYYTWIDGGKGGAAGQGAICRSGGVAGNTYLSRSEYTNALHDGYNGMNMPYGGKASGLPTVCDGDAGNGTAYCSDGTFAEDCGDDASYSQSDIRRNNVVQAATTAKSASKGGLGGYRYWNGAAGSSYCNVVLSQTNPDGVSGNCTVGEPVESSWCSSIGGKTGYCLKRYNNTYAPNGSYSYRYSFDENYLQYGDPGSAGEYKTMVIRSFKDMDTSIHIGRGGAAGAPNSGASGAKGSATHMGDLIYAAGGNGGKGGLVTATEVLQGYTPAKFNSNSLVKKAGSISGSAPTLKGLASNLFSYVLPRIQDALYELFISSGHGGSGGGVTHYCWAGQWIVEFEGVLMSTSIYPGNSYITPDYQIKETPADGHRVPESCYNNFKIDKATDGTDGALMIRW